MPTSTERTVLRTTIAVAPNPQAAVAILICRPARKKEKTFISQKILIEGKHFDLKLKRLEAHLKGGEFSLVYNAVVVELILYA